MSLGTKILLSFFSISLLIATVGVTSNWYIRSILDQLVSKNAETTQMVELTANIENGLYQSLISLIALNDEDQPSDQSIILSEPTQQMHRSDFSSSIILIDQNLTELEQLIYKEETWQGSHIYLDVQLVRERFQFYNQLSLEWLEFVIEDKEQAQQMFVTSLNPYFRNNIIPVITHLREEAIYQQSTENLALDLQINRANISIILIAAFLIFISVGMALYLYRSIANPLKKLNIVAQSLGTGNLEERVEISKGDEIGELAESFNSMASSLQKRTLARDYLDNIIESIHESLLVTDENGKIVGMNKAAEDLFRYKKAELIDKPLYELLEGELANLQKLTPQAQFEGAVETELVTKKGARIPALFSESNLINSKDEFVGKVVVATDITQRKRANERIKQSLKEKEILLAEIHHRVKNNLAVISGILQLQSQSSSNKQVVDALTESQTRIQSISLVHEMLYQSETMANIEYDEYVIDLAAAISKLPLSQDKAITITTETEPVSLDLNTAVPCSLLLNEIIVDRLKTSFKEVTDGEIHVILRNLDTNAELSVEHNGTADSTTNPKETLGFTLIKTLINQLHGTYFEEYLESRDVHRIRIIFPKDSGLN